MPASQSNAGISVLLTSYFSRYPVRAATTLATMKTPMMQAMNPTIYAYSGSEWVIVTMLQEMVGQSFSLLIPYF